MSYSWLPPVLAEIADIAGLDAAMALAEARGGQRVFIPASAGPDHWLVRTVGETAASLICEHYRGGTNGETIDVPAGPASSYRKQARKIRQMIDGGASSNEIVRATGLVFRTVTRHRARARSADNRQGKLL